MGELPPDFEQHLADLSDIDWSALTARVRPPSSATQLREIAGKVIDGDKLEAFVQVANVKAFATDNGDIDEGKVRTVLAGMFGTIPAAGPPHADFGQHQPPPPQPGPGERGAAEAQRRFKTAPDVGTHPEIAKRFPKGPSIPPATHRHTSNGHGGAAEAVKRFGPKE